MSIHETEIVKYETKNLFIEVKIHKPIITTMNSLIFTT